MSNAVACAIKTPSTGRGVTAMETCASAVRRAPGGAVDVPEGTREAASLFKPTRRMSMKLSARNVLQGTVSKITKGAVNSEVQLTLAGGAPIVSVVTNGAIENLGLKEGASAFAIIKASSVMLGTDLHDAKVSARN